MPKCALPESLEQLGQETFASVINTLAGLARQELDLQLLTLDECCEVLCPQLLDVALRTTQESIDVETVGVGTDLRRDPGDQPHEGGCQRLPETQLALEARQRYLHLLPLAALPEAFGHQQDA